MYKKKQLMDVTPALAKKFEEYDKKLIDMDKEIKSLKYLITKQEQYNIRNELDIIGVPHTKTEDLIQIILAIANKLGVELQETDIDEVHRVGPKLFHPIAGDAEPMTKPIVVKFVRKYKRDQVLSAARGKSSRNRTSEDIVSGTNSHIYVNERLSHNNWMLYQDARKVARLNNYQFCWVRNGVIYVRKSADKGRHPAMAIRSFKDLETKFGPDFESIYGTESESE